MNLATQQRCFNLKALRLLFEAVTQVLPHRSRLLPQSALRVTILEKPEPTQPSRFIEKKPKVQTSEATVCTAVIKVIHVLILCWELALYGGLLAQVHFHFQSSSFRFQYSPNLKSSAISELRSLDSKLQTLGGNVALLEVL